MYLVNNKALIARSSSKILFFKICPDRRDPDKKEWQQYHELSIGGSIYFIKGNKRIQVTTDDLVYFYLIDPDTFMPQLENVMYNFMDCSQMMFGSRVKYGITYKGNEQSFDIYRRKYMHDFKVPVVDFNFEGSHGIDLPLSNAFIVTQTDKLFLYDSDSFQPIGRLPVALLTTITREPNEIIAVQKSKDENYVACISGKNLIKNEQKGN